MERVVADVRAVLVKPEFMEISGGRSARFSNTGYQLSNLSASLPKISFFMDGVYVDPRTSIRSTHKDWDPGLVAEGHARRIVIGLHDLSDAIGGEAAIFRILWNITPNEDPSGPSEIAKKIHRTAVADLNDALINMDKTAHNLAVKKYGAILPNREAIEDILAQAGVVRRS